MTTVEQDLFLKENAYITSNRGYGIKYLNDSIHYFWKWGEGKVKMVGYKYNIETKETGEKLYFVSPSENVSVEYIKNLVKF